MKKAFIISILVMVAAIAVAVVSCKKETANTMLNNQPQVTKSFYPESVDDMDAYLKAFKQKMRDSQYTRDDETFSLEEAAWYLSSVANYDFANVNVEFTDLRYDTLYYNVNVSNGQVSLTDLNVVYQSIASDIDSFYQSLNLENKHFRFIGASISNSGEVVVTLITSFTWLDHTWYFADGFEAFVMCDSLFSEDSVYVWNTTAARELQRVINQLEGHEYMVIEEPGQNDRGYYVYTMDVPFGYQDYSDPYYSPFYSYSRICAIKADIISAPILDMEEMCYCLDSYLQLPVGYINTHANLIAQHPVHWKVEGVAYDPYEYPNDSRWYLYCHIITVKLGRYVSNSGGNNDY